MTHNTTRLLPGVASAAASTALTAGLSGQLAEKWPFLPHVKQARSAISILGCLHSAAEWPLRAQLTQVISALHLPVGGPLLEVALDLPVPC